MRGLLRRPAGIAALAVLALVLLAGLLAPWIAPHDPGFVNLRMIRAAPGGDYLMGGDSAGRDILSRLIWGARVTLWGALVTLAVAVVAGVPAGVVAGYSGGLADRVLSWISDALQAVPGMILLLVIAAGTRSNFEVLMATVGLLLSPGFFRIARSTARGIRAEPYIDAARVSGLGHARILRRHVMPGVAAPVVIQSALAAGIGMGIQAGLQFLGVGAASVPSWGAMMSEGFRFMISAPWMLVWPGAALGVTIAALAVLGSTLGEVVQRHPIPTAAAPVPAARPGDDLPANGAALRIEELRVSYGAAQVVKGVSLSVGKGEVLGIVGESGSGKSQTILAMLGLLPSGARAQSRGLWLGETRLDRLPPAARAAIPGRRIGYIPQEPMSNLDPCFPIGAQLTVPLRLVNGLSKPEAEARAREMLARVGIRDIDRVMRAYPHQISGGMAQRVLIAGAVPGRPEVLLADEPTTALDVTVQAEVLELLRSLQAEYRMALVIVTHNFGVVADLCDRVAVMQSGEVVEAGTVAQVFAAPVHACTRALIEASLDETPPRATLDMIAVPA